MREYDFVFVYEVKNRELENICLLRYELERRGYKVAFINSWDQEFRRTRPLKTKVVVGFALYHDDTVKFISSKVIGCNKIVNLQWEQVFTNGSMKRTRVSEGSVSDGVSGLAKKAVHVSWGRENYRTLTELYDVSPRNVWITGHVGLDFLRSEMRAYYLSRDELLRHYHISPNKKICLFISSLSFVNFPLEVLNSPLYQDAGVDLKFMTLCEQTQRTLISWFEQVLSSREDCVFIYRPHPAERCSSLLAETVVRCPNFHVISDHSVKQWILAADNIYLWWSTAVAEVYAAKKTCCILRPVPISFDREIVLYNNARIISDYENFANTVGQTLPFPIHSETFNTFYDIDANIPAYKKICDMLERVLKDKSYYVPLPENTSSFFKRLRFNLRNWMRQRIACSEIFSQTVLGKRLFLWKYPGNQNDFNATIDKYLYYMQMQKNNHLSKREVSTIIKRIRKVLNDKKVNI